nr:hypothetical protein [Tanacetum cinerariifolium]
MGDENPMHTLGDYSRLTMRAIKTPLSSPMGTMWCLCDLTPSGWSEIDRTVGSKLRDKNAEESWEIIENLAERNSENNKVVDKNIVELSELNAIVPKEVVDMKKEVEDGANDEPVRNIEDEIMGDGIEELVEMPRSHTVRYYLKHEINEKLVKGLIGIVEDVLVEIAGYIYLVDFVILDIKEDKKKPFILRIPY